jgi:hypothetical protein
MSSRTDSHTITHAENVFSGDGRRAGAQDAGRGLPRIGIVQADFGTPALGDADGYAVAQAVAGAGNLTLNGALVVAGVGIADVTRVVQAVSANVGDTTQTLTVTGTDQYGEALTEDLALNGTTPVIGTKAFKQVTQIAISAATAGNVSAGTEDLLGLPFAIGSAGDAIAANENNVYVDPANIVAADTTSPATALTGDIRGTFNPTVALNGSTVVKLLYVPAGRKTVSGYGVPQA